MMSQDFQIQSSNLALGNSYLNGPFPFNPAQLAFAHQIKPTISMSCSPQIMDPNFGKQHIQNMIQQNQQHQQQTISLQQQHLQAQQIQQQQQQQNQQSQSQSYKNKSIHLSLSQPSPLQTQQLLQQQSQTLTAPASSPYAKQSINNCCTNEFCNLGFQTQMRPQDKNRFVEQARSQGVSVACVNCAQHDMKQIIERIKQDGEIFVLFNSNKISSLTQMNDNSYTTIPSEQNDNLTMMNSGNNSISTQQQQQSQIPSLPNISAPPTTITPPQALPSMYPLTQNIIQFQKAQAFNFPQSNIPSFPISEQMMKDFNSQANPMVQQMGLPFQQPQHGLAYPMILNHQEAGLKLLQNVQGQQPLPYLPSINLSAGYPLHNQALASEGKSIEEKKDLQKAPLPKQRHGLFKKTYSSSSKVQSSKDFKVKVEGGQDISNSSSKNSSNELSNEDDSSDSFSDNLNNNNNNQLSGQNGSEVRLSKSSCQKGSTALVQSKSNRRGGENNANLTPEEIEKQNKIKERRKTNNFGHIYTWLKNQIRLYYGDRELYEKIQSYFQRVNKYNEVVTDESSSKWQFFLFQIKDNTSLKTFLKDKIKSEHFHEYIKTRKGKDQKVFYEFRIGVIYGIDHPELSNQPKNCLLMAKKDPEYCNINFGW